MARPKKKKPIQSSSTTELSKEGAAVVNALPSNGHGSDLVTKPSETLVVPEVLRSKQEIDQAIGCCAVATDADCVTVKSSKASASCDFCGEPSSGRIFVFRQGLELRQGYEKDACAAHRRLSGGPMP